MEQRTALRDKGVQTRILGVDTALRNTGYGVLETDGNNFTVLDCGLIQNKRQASLSSCLHCLSSGVSELLELYKPHETALEGSFYFRNAKTAMLLGMARGAVVAAITRAGMPIYEYAPRRAKQAVCGNGNAQKEQVALVLQQLLNMQVAGIPHDATDALSLAVCHANCRYTTSGILLPEPL